MGATSRRSAAERRTIAQRAAKAGAAATRAPTALSDPYVAVWFALLPCAAIVLLVVYGLGPALGGLIYPATSPYTFWPSLQGMVVPEPTEQARYLLALGAPPLLSLATAALVLRAPDLRSRVVAVTVPVMQALVAAFVVVCLVVQYAYVYGTVYTFEPGVTYHRQYFTPATLVVAVLLAGLVLAAARRGGARERVAAWTRASRARTVGAVAVAAAMTAAWMLQAVNTDASIGTSVDAVAYHLEFTLDETFAVLNGRSPLVDFTAQYGSLWPYLVALVMSVFGKTLLVFTLTMVSITTVSLLLMYDVLRRITRNAVLALLLYLPFVATSMFTIRGDAVNRYSMATYFGGFPLRYAGPFVLAWLTTRRLQRGTDRWDWAIFTVAGIVLLNNADYGVAALGATVAAILWTSGVPRPRPVLRLVVNVLGGLLLAGCLVSLLTLLRAGSLPEPGRLVDYARVYATGGFAMLPLPGVIGLHTIVYVTYVAAIATAMVRALSHADDRMLTGMLAWSGVFGLGSAAYYMGRSHPEALTAVFSAWTFALALLTVVAVQSVVARGRSLPSIASVVVLVGFGVTACSLAQTPTPWTQAERLAGGHAPEFVLTAEPLPFVPKPDTRGFFSSTYYGGRFHAKPGTPVANLATAGHRISDAFGVVNVSRYTGTSIIGPDMLRTVIADLRAVGGNTMFVFAVDFAAYDVLTEEGFEILNVRGDLQPFRPNVDAEGRRWTGAVVTKWVDTRNPQPEGLRVGRGAPVPQGAG